MMKLLMKCLRHSVLVPATLLVLSLEVGLAQAQTQIYTPVTLPDSREITDTLSEQDIPTGFGGYARDYTVYFESGDQVAIDAISDQFDTLVTLMGPDGITIGENDDGPDGTT
ncbi:MAG: pre-peptidase, partial [Cyanobacteria bacterium J06639_16]